MSTPALRGLASIAKNHPFFALSLFATESIPDDRTKKTEAVFDYSRDYDEDNRSHRIKRFDDVNRLGHVRPKNEIDDRLRPAKQNETRPNEIPPADQCADHQPNLVGLATSLRCNYAVLPARLRDDECARNSLGD